VTASSALLRHCFDTDSALFRDCCGTASVTVESKGRQKGEAMEAPREVTIYQSANRPNLLMGCDRELVLMVVLLCAALIFSVATLWGVVVGVCAWVAGVALLSRMAKVDPLLRQVYLRHVKYGGFYPAKSGLRAQAMQVGKGWK